MIIHENTESKIQKIELNLIYLLNAFKMLKQTQWLFCRFTLLPIEIVFLN